MGLCKANQDFGMAMSNGQITGAGQRHSSLSELVERVNGWSPQILDYSLA